MFIKSTNCTGGMGTDYIPGRTYTKENTLSVFGVCAYFEQCDWSIFWYSKVQIKTLIHIFQGNDELNTFQPTPAIISYLQSD